MPRLMENPLSVLLLPPPPPPQGITDNLSLMSRFYPGWIMRVYTDQLAPEHPMMKAGGEEGGGEGRGGGDSQAIGLY